MRGSVHKWISTLVVSCAFLMVARETRSEDDAMAEAKDFYTEAKTHFSEGRFEEAMAAFTESYNLSGEPNLLFNLGACAEKMGDTERATAYYQLYLEEIPDAPDATEVRTRVEMLKTGRPPVTSPTAEVQNEAAPEKPPRDAPSTEGQPADDAARYDGLEVEEDGRTVFWPGIAIGAGGLLLAGGMITAILAYKEYDGLERSCAPECSDDDMATAKNLALASDLQFGLGAAAVIAGAVGWIVIEVGEKGDESAAWYIAPGATPQGGGVVIKGEF